MKQVAHRAGKSQQWLSDRLHGRSPIYADDIYALAQGLKVDPCEFLRTDDAVEGPTYLNQDTVASKWADRVLGLPEQQIQLLVDFLEFQRARE